MIVSDTLNLRLQHLFLAIYKYNHLYVELFGWCDSTKKGGLQRSTSKNESTYSVRTFQTWTHGRLCFRHEKVDNKM